MLPRHSDRAQHGNGIAALDWVERAGEWHLSLDAMLTLHHHHRAGLLTDDEIGWAADCHARRLELLGRADSADLTFRAQLRDAA